MKKVHFLLFVFLMLFLVSCSLKPLPPERVVFLNPTMSIKKTSRKTVPISVNYYYCNNVLDSYSVYVQTGRYQLTPLPGFVWIDTPCNMIKNSIVKTLSMSGYNVVEFAANKLNFELFELQPVIEKNRLSCKISIKFKLKTNNKTFPFYFSRTKIMKNKKDFILCLNKLVEHMDRSLVGWIDEKLRPAIESRP